MSLPDASTSFTEIEITVQWGDMDAAQHVNNTIYLRWMESARLAMFEKMNEGEIDFNKVGPILAWQDCKYIFPVTYPDTIVLHYNVTEVNGDKIMCEGKMYSKKYQRIVAIGNTSIKAYDFVALKKEDIPSTWINVIKDFYGDSVLVTP